MLKHLRDAFFIPLFLLILRRMRWIKDIPHERYKIQIHNYNGKYIVKIELGQFEQVYKISEMDVVSLDELEIMISKDLLSNALKRFVDMRSDWETSFKKKNSL